MWVLWVYLSLSGVWRFFFFFCQFRWFWGWVCSLHRVGYVEGIRVLGVFVVIAYVWELLGKYLHVMTGNMRIRVVISVYVVCC